MVPKRRDAVPVGDLVAGALKELGMPSIRLTRKFAEAWDRVAGTWGDRVVPLRLTGGVLEIGVTSSSLRQELSQFHRERLLAVLQAALPDVPLVALRFTACPPKPGVRGTQDTENVE